MTRTPSGPSSSKSRPKSTAKTLSLKRSPTFLALVWRLLRGACPTHGIALMKTGIDKDPILDCPRKDCSWAWMGELPKMTDRIVDVAVDLHKNGLR